MGPILWSRDNRSLSAGDRVSIRTSSRPSPDASPRSQLHVRRATFLDSGLYSCGGEHLKTDTVQVMVTEGECQRVDWTLSHLRRLSDRL